MFNRSHPVVSMQNDLQIPCNWSPCRTWLLEAVCAIILSLSYSNLQFLPTNATHSQRPHGVVHGFDTFSLSLIPLPRECSSRLRLLHTVFQCFFRLPRVQNQNKRKSSCSTIQIIFLFNFCEISPSCTESSGNRCSTYFSFLSLRQIFSPRLIARVKKMLSIKSAVNW